MRYLFILLISILPFSSHVAAGDFPAKDVYERISPSVVIVRASGAGKEGMIGAGSVISNNGLVITNSHVVLDKAGKKPYPEIDVYLKPSHLTGDPENDMKRAFKSALIHYSIPLDLAVLKVSGIPSDIPAVVFADPKEIKVGEEVVAIGHPEDGGFWSLTYGRISGEMLNFQGVKGKDVYQTDTSINRGNSGGPLLDRRGYMVAVNSSIARISKDGLPITGVNFAIKSKVVKEWMEKNGFVVAYGKEAILEGDMQVKSSQISEDNEKFIEPLAADNLLTPRKPYDYDSVLKIAEKELEDMIGDMRGKIKRK